MRWEFSQASVDQVSKLHELVNSAYRGESSKKGWTTEEKLLEGQRIDPSGLRELIERENSVILVAENESNGALEGCVHLEKQAERCYLGMLTVKPVLQGRGLGTELLREAEAFAQFWDCSRMYMTVIAQREELIQWYEKSGYQRTSQTKAFPYGDERFGIPKISDLYFIVMEKQL